MDIEKVVGMMFIGEYQHAIDAKGRFIVPAKLREDLGERFVMTKGLDSCLFIYPMEEWIKIEAKLKSLPLTSKNARAFVRFFFSGASECETDKQGRVLISANLRQHAQIEKEIVTIGVGNRLEVWSKSLWNNYTDDDELSYDAIAEQMAELGI